MIPNDSRDERLAHGVAAAMHAVERVGESATAGIAQVCLEANDFIDHPLRLRTKQRAVRLGARMS